MKISIVVTNNKKSNPNDLIANSLDRIKNYIDKEFPNQYQIQELEHSITKENLTLNFSCRTIGKEIENNNDVEEIQSLVTKANLKKIVHMDNTFDISEIIITPTKKLGAIKRIDADTVKIDPYFADYCARHLSYCKDMLKRDVQNIIIEYEQKANNDEYCTGKFEEKYIKNTLNKPRSSNLNNVYHCFATVILKNDNFKNKLISSGIRTVLMKNNGNDITLEVETSNEAHYSYSIKKAHSLLTPYSESLPLLAVGMYAVKINGEDPDPFEQNTRLLSNSNFF
ncbi:hypothetical protein Lgra_0456 [Legionella gratiana]|uniref:Uncharacterized protein n=1 Tax=Legionella gratiana TaxID=45066 RepID=A0A378JAU0_9GAMM|nr:hypothetical protein [Legionella gratiana]KTD14753.1 hypothetical protein Lgra_0456 [Legionella gratiana]STX44258.1 Uncharacterised protein [Legionella gratiana]